MTRPGTSPQLEYAPQPRRLRSGRWLIICTILVTAIFARNFPVAVLHFLQLKYWEHQCAAHPVLPGTLVYSSGPPATALASADAAALITAGLRDYHWGAVYNGFGRATIFAGTLGRGLGSKFVTVEAWSIAAPNWGGEVNLALNQFDLSLSNQMDYGNSSSGADLFVKPIKGADIEIYSAIPVPGDSSRIRFVYRMYQEEYTMEVYLTDGKASLQQFSCKPR